MATEESDEPWNKIEKKADLPTNNIEDETDDGDEYGRPCHTTSDDST